MTKKERRTRTATLSERPVTDSCTTLVSLGEGRISCPRNLIAATMHAARRRLVDGYRQPLRIVDPDFSRRAAGQAHWTSCPRDCVRLASTKQESLSGQRRTRSSFRALNTPKRAVDTISSGVVCQHFCRNRKSYPSALLSGVDQLFP
jgi:hypothetical protein